MCATGPQYPVAVEGLLTYSHGADSVQRCHFLLLLLKLIQAVIQNYDKIPNSQTNIPNQVDYHTEKLPNLLASLIGTSRVS